MQYLAIGGIAFLAVGAAILLYSVNAHLLYLATYQQMKKDFEQFKCTHHSCDPPTPPDWLDYDSSIPWGFTIGAGLLAGGAAVVLSAVRSRRPQTVF